MKKISEAEFQKQVIQLARLQGWLVAHFRTARIQRKDGSTYFQTPVQADGAGFPDLLLIRGACLIVAELKVGRNQPSIQQHAWLAAFRVHGALAFVWTPKDWTLIEQILGG